MKEDLKVVLERAKKAVGGLAGVSGVEKKRVLLSLAKVLEENKEKILEENKRDIAGAKRQEKSEAFVDRLTFSERSFAGMVAQVRAIAAAPDSVGEKISKKKLANGLWLEKVRVPIGVIAVIYESRPNVTVDVFALCFKSGNVAVLKGGSEAIHTNRALVACITHVLTAHGLPADVLVFLDTTSRSVVSELVTQRNYVDVVVPRGGYELVEKIVQESKIPVLYHAAGGARIYVDASADLSAAVAVCVNAKTNRPGTCNSLDTVVVHEGIAKKFLPLLIEKFWANDVVVRGDTRTRNIVSLDVAAAVEADYDTEFLDYVVSIKVVKDVDEALVFIEKHTKRHSEGIVATDEAVIKRFVQSVDAAGIFVNCSTRFHDGGVFGLGAELGVATGKLHARGPVGLMELLTYKWVVYGKGQVRE